MQLAFLAQFPREMYQTDRIHPRYFLLWIRVSIRPRYFVNAKKPIPGQTSPRPGRMLQRHRPSERRNLKRRLYLHARWRLTSAAGGYEWFCWHPCKTTRLRKSYPCCNDPAKRGSQGSYKREVFKFENIQGFFMAVFENIFENIFRANIWQSRCFLHGQRVTQHQRLTTFINYIAIDYSNTCQSTTFTNNAQSTDFI